MKISDVYQQYQIMPSLQLHMLRVAGVANLICDHFPDFAETHEVVLACLLHDMGNIVKFDLQKFPQFLEPAGLAYWENLKQEVETKYSKNAHQATLKIVTELSLSPRVSELIDAISFNHAKRNFESTDFAAKICAYADMRVAPHGVTSLTERLDDGRQRYTPEDKHDAFSYAMGAFVKKIETQIFEKTETSPAEITEATVQKIIPELKNFEL